MGTLVAQPTWISGTANTAPFYGETQISVVHTDGTIGVIYKDPIDGTDANKIKFKTSADNGETWTERASFDAPVDFSVMGIAQFSNGDIAVVIKAATLLTLRYTKITWGTWAVAAWETVYTYASPAVFGKFDVETTDTGVVVIAAQVYNGSTQFYNAVFHRTTAGVWNRAINESQWGLGGEARRSPGEGISIVALDVSANVRQYIVVASVLSSKLDYGLFVYAARINETNGTASDLNSSQPGVMLGLYGIGVDVTTSSNSASILRRVRVFRTGTTEYTVMSYVYPSSSSLAYNYGQFMSHTGSFSATTPLGDPHTPTKSSSTALSSSLNGKISQVGFSIDDDKVCNFAYNVTNQDLTRKIWCDVHYFNESATRKYAQGLSYAENFPNAFLYISDGARRNLDLYKHAFISAGKNASLTDKADVFFYNDTVPDKLDDSSAVISLVPADGAQQQLATPVIQATVDTDRALSQSLYRVQFQLATDAGFTASVKTYTQNTTKLKRVDGTITDGVVVDFSDVLPGAYSLSKTTWYYRARLMDIYGNTGAWSASNSFVVGHPPAAVPISPKGGGMYEWNGGVRQFMWEFTDPSATDYQTAYQLVIQDESGVVLDTGKIVSANKSHSYTFAGAYEDVDLNWYVRLWDSDDTVGLYSNSEWFVLTEPPTVTIEEPDPAEVVATGVPTFEFTPSTGGGRTIVEYTVTVTKGADIIWSKRVSTPGLASGTPQSVKIEQGYLLNNTSYSVQVIATDSGSLSGVSPLVTFSTAWIPPASPTGLNVDIGQYNVEEAGYVLFSWNDLARDVDFASWVVSRKADLIDPVTGVVVEEGEWEDVHTDYSIQSAYEYRDFYAPSNYRVTYRVIQWVNRIGQDIPSLPATSEFVVPVSDGYWLIEPSDGTEGTEAFKLSIVTGDNFSDEQEEEEFTVIGRGRVVNKGQRLGNKGTLDVQIRDTGNTTARQKRLRLVKMQQQTRLLYLRNPFGDIFRVSVSNMSIGRVAGVGASEFCDVSIPYSEVG